MAAEHADFEREVNLPVKFIEIYQNNNQGRRITPEQLKIEMEGAGFQHVGLEHIVEAIKAYYGELLTMSMTSIINLSVTN